VAGLAFTVLWIVSAACVGRNDETGGERADVVGEEELGPPAILANNVFYYYRDVGAARDFYTRVLGFETVADYGFAKILRVAPTSFLTLVDVDEGMHDGDAPKTTTLAVVTREVEGWWEYLRERGVEMRAPLGEVGVGRAHDGFVAVDPEGYLLEFERFNPHPENEALTPVLDAIRPLHPEGGETASGSATSRPDSLGVQATVQWLYYEGLQEAQDFYEEVMGLDLMVDQGWAKVYPTSPTGFLGLVDGERGLHQATEEKAVTVSFLTPEVEGWLEYLRKRPDVELRSPKVGSEGDFVLTLVGYDPEGYFLEWDTFLDVPVNAALLDALSGQSR
jgi:catechol 2,3-dioxygenase-like lactoylglutathione lyase family enzyme